MNFLHQCCSIGLRCFGFFFFWGCGGQRFFFLAPFRWHIISLVINITNDAPHFSILTLAWAFPSHSAVTTYQRSRRTCQTGSTNIDFSADETQLADRLDRKKTRLISLCWRRPRTANTTNILVMCTETIRNWVCFGSPVRGCTNIHRNNISNTTRLAGTLLCAAATEVASCHHWVFVNLYWPSSYLCDCLLTELLSRSILLGMHRG